MKPHRVDLGTEYLKWPPFPLKLRVPTKRLCQKSYALAARLQHGPLDWVALNDSSGTLSVDKRRHQLFFDDPIYLAFEGETLFSLVLRLLDAKLYPRGNNPVIHALRCLHVDCLPCLW